MSRIEELIQELCPDGVEYKELGDVMTIKRGASPRPIFNFITTDVEGIPWIKIGDVNLKEKYITKTKEKITKEGAEKSRFLKKGAFVLSNSMSFGRPYILGIDGCIHDGWISMQDFEDVLMHGYLYHLLRSDNIQNYWKHKASSGTVKNLNADIVKATIIPIPPLPIQQEIVSILDKFTQLGAELEAELEERKRQYEFYLQELLDFEKEKIEWKMLGNVSEILRGTSITQKQAISGKFPVVANAPIPSYYHIESNRSGEIIVIARSGAYCGLVSYWNEPLFLTDAFSIHPDNNLFITKFVYYFLKRDQRRIHLMKKGHGVPHVQANEFESYIIPLLPISKQNRLVEILDKFDTLVNDIKVGLPAEIAARQKQYEYYRARLLNFKEKQRHG